MAVAKPRIAEHDVVALRCSIHGWPAGTTGTALIDEAPWKLIEISDDRGQMLDLVEVAEEDLDLIWKAPPWRATEGGGLG